MKINSKLKRVKTVCGVELQPGEHSYKKLSLKNSVQRFKLLALREAGMVDFKSDDKLKDGELPVPLGKEEVAKREEAAKKAKDYAEKKAKKVAKRKAEAEEAAKKAAKTTKKNG